MLSEKLTERITIKEQTTINTERMVHSLKNSDRRLDRAWFEYGFPKSRKGKQP